MQGSSSDFFDRNAELSYLKEFVRFPAMKEWELEEFESLLRATISKKIRKLSAIELNAHAKYLIVFADDMLTECILNAVQSQYHYEKGIFDKIFILMGYEPDRGYPIFELKTIYH
jgi:hypothetical protein